MIEQVEDVARAAGERAMEWFRELDRLNIESKGPLDLVTQADRELEIMIAERLHNLFPDDAIFGEEGRRTSGGSGGTWVIDPIDGTFNFLRGGGEWGISIGLHQSGGPLLGVVNLPAVGQLFCADGSGPARLNGSPLSTLAAFDERRASLSIGLGSQLPLEGALDVLGLVMGKAGFALRACGSCIAGMMEVARGETDVYLGLAEHSWDVMAALPIVLSLGGRSSLDWSRVSLNEPLFLAAGKSEAVRRLEGMLGMLA